MIQKFVERFEARKHELHAAFAMGHPGCYHDIVRLVVGVLEKGGDYDDISAARITEIDHGDYQGTLLYVIGGSGYQTSTFWGVCVSYGSCSGCDTLQAIRSASDRGDDTPTAQQVSDYMTLALHIVQGLKPLFSCEGV